MPNHPTPQDQLNPQYGTELLLVTVASVLLVVVLVAIASTSVALIVLAIVATSALAVVIAALVLRMTSDPGEGRALLNPATRPERPRPARPRAQARRTVASRVSHTHERPRIRRKAAPGTAREVFSSLAYAAALHDNSAALAQEAQRRQDRANDAGEAQPVRAVALRARSPGRCTTRPSTARSSASAAPTRSTRSFPPPR
jgi:hypothetical protein